MNNSFNPHTLYTSFTQSILVEFCVRVPLRESHFITFGATGWCRCEHRVEPGSAGNSSAQSHAPAARNGARGIRDWVGAMRGEMGAAGGCELDRIVERSGTGSHT
jgi:hypothetical protein